MKFATAMVALALVPFSASVAAVTLDFEGLAPDYTGTVIVEGQYRFQSAGIFRVSTNSGTNAVLGPNPFNPLASPMLTLSRTDGGAFNFLSIEVYAADGNGLGVPIGFSGRYADGSSTYDPATTPYFGRSAAIPATRTLLLLPASFLNIVAVSWQNGAFFHQFDNVVVEAATSSAPEPGSWALLIGGFGLIGAALRWRRSVAAVQAD